MAAVRRRVGAREGRVAEGVQGGPGLDRRAGSSSRVGVGGAEKWHVGCARPHRALANYDSLRSGFRTGLRPVAPPSLLSLKLPALRGSGGLPLRHGSRPPRQCPRPARLALLSCCCCLFSVSVCRFFFFTDVDEMLKLYVNKVMFMFMLLLPAVFSTDSISISVASSVVYIYMKIIRQHTHKKKRHQHAPTHATPPSTRGSLSLTLSHLLGPAAGRASRAPHPVPEPIPRRPAPRAENPELEYQQWTPQHKSLEPWTPQLRVKYTCSN